MWDPINPAPPVTRMRKRDPFNSRRNDAASQAYSKVPPFALILVTAAVVLGTLAATPLPFDERALVAAGCVALGAYAYWRRCETRQLRVLVLCALAAGAVNAVCHEKGVEAPF